MKKSAPVKKSTFKPCASPSWMPEKTKVSIAFTSPLRRVSTSPNLRLSSDVGTLSQQMPKEPGAKPQEEVLGHPCRQVVIEETNDAAQYVQSDVRARQPDEGIEVARDQDIVHENLVEIDLHRL